MKNRLTLQLSFFFLIILGSYPCYSKWHGPIERYSKESFGIFFIEINNSFTNKPNVDASIKVIKLGKTIFEQSWKGLQPSGSVAGISFPKVQPFSNPFIVFVNGDENDRALLIFEDGSVVDTPQGQFYVDSESNRLYATFIDNGPQSSEAVVIDLKTSKKIFSWLEKASEPNQEFRDLYVLRKSLKQTCFVSEKNKKRIYCIDYANQKLTRLNESSQAKFLNESRTLNVKYVSYQELGR